MYSFTASTNIPVSVEYVLDILIVNSTLDVEISGRRVSQSHVLVDLHYTGVFVYNVN